MSLFRLWIYYHMWQSQVKIEVVCRVGEHQHRLAHRCSLCEVEIWGWGINGLNEWAIHGLNGWGIHGLNGWGIYGLNGWGIHGLTGWGIHGLNGWGIHGLTGWGIYDKWVQGTVMAKWVIVFGRYARKILVFRRIPFPVLAWPRVLLPLNSWPQKGRNHSLALRNPALCWHSQWYIWIFKLLNRLGVGLNGWSYQLRGWANQHMDSHCRLVLLRWEQKLSIKNLWGATILHTNL